MKILIISFDKNLVSGLENVFSEHDVFTAKNAEEAITLSPPDVDVVIFDAISGAISEEEINQLYKEKFKNQRYVILYDELFPIDEQNILPPDKVLVSRDAPPEEIAKTVLGQSAPPKEPPPPAEEKKQEPAEEKGKEKPLVLIVSFDKKLTDSLEKLLSGRYGVEVVKNMKAVREKGLSADIIVYDAISGSIAERNLMEISEVPELREKPFLILMDELFPIDVERINLPKKAVINRDAPHEVIVEEIERLITGAPSEVKEEPLPPPQPEPERVELPEVPQTQKQEVHESVSEGEVKEISRALSEKLADEKFVKMVIVEAISRELQGLRDEIKLDAKEYIKDTLESVIREEIEKSLLEIGIANIIREETRKIVEKKISELLR
ncbi:MAG: hypothetical protein GXO04_04615 [Aquificae bacterium]|nr:hypothetical protein [Aquificota bacterium]